MFNRYTLYPDDGHGVWNYTYDRKDFFEFFRQYSKLSIRVFGGSGVCEGDDSVRIGISSGFKAYEWKKDGQVIADADTNDYYVKEPGDYTVRVSRVENPDPED